MKQKRGASTGPLVATLILLVTSAADRAPARAAAPDTWQYEMVQTWGRDEPGAKRHTRLARVWVKGDRMRREEGDMITIVAGGWRYHLQKNTKRGVKQRAGKQSKGAPRAAWSHLPSPEEFARQVRKSARKVGSEQIGGRRMTVYETNTGMRVWVGSDGLAYRTAARKPEYHGFYVWEMRNLRRGAPMSDSLFRPPSDYKVAEVALPPLNESGR